MPDESTSDTAQQRDFRARTAAIVRETNETSVRIELNLDAGDAYDNKTGIGFLDHMLDLFAKHGRFGLHVRCDGDLEVDAHHTVEDVGIALGQAFGEALGEKGFIRRYGHAYVPMDASLARAVIDLSGRFYLHFRADIASERVGDLPVEMVEHFWYSFAEHARCNLHVDVLHGRNAHHQIEAIFKAVARALREAVHRDAAFSRMPSTKGTL
ncbi:MAG: imidazoleglycerol-phosphate dehydratase HisB [Rhodothermales bacterium]